jgi:hypothetical protein
MSIDDIKCYIAMVREMKRLSCHLGLCCFKVIYGSIVGFCV